MQCVAHLPSLSVPPTGLPRTTMSVDRTHPYGLVSPSLCSRLVQSWLEEDCPGFDYAGYVVGDFRAEASIIGRSPVRDRPISFKMRKINDLMMHQIPIRYGLEISGVYSCYREYLLDYRSSMRFFANWIACWSPTFTVVASRRAEHYSPLVEWIGITVRANRSVLPTA